MLKKVAFFTFLLLVILFTIKLNGQSLKRSSLSCFGSTYTEGGLIIRQTIGQPSNTTVENNGLLVLRQGFQQPVIKVNVPDQFIPIEFTLSPNPAREKTKLELNAEIDSYNILISNLNGLIISRIDDQAALSRWLDLTNLQPGIYIVTITNSIRSGSKKLIISH